MPNAAKRASGCLILFSIPFTFGGLFFVIVSLRSLHDPSFRNPWIGVGMGSLFAVIGGLIMAAGSAVLRSAKRESAVEAAYPGQPWMWRKDWAQGRAHGQVLGKPSPWYGSSTLIWNGLSLTFAYAVTLHGLPPAQRMIYLFVAIFPLVGIALLVWAGLQTLRLIRFGKTSLQLQTLPASLGHNLRGTIEARFLTHSRMAFAWC